jgi:hypothetical protein
VAEEDGPAAERLVRWLDLLVEAKQARARDDPELFATYVQIAGESREVITAHVVALVSQLDRIVADGAERGEFAVDDPRSAARAVFDATARFHNPANAASWTDPGIGTAYEEVRMLVTAGLMAPTGRAQGSV